MRKGDVVAVFWQDSIAPVDVTWIRESDIDGELPVLVSVGAVVKITRSSLTLASSFSRDMLGNDEQLAGVMTIPRKTILEVRDLEWAEGE